MFPQFTSEPALRLILPAVTLLVAMLGFFRGLGRLLVLVLSLAGGAAAGMSWFRWGPDWFIRWFGSLPLWLVNYGALISGVLAAWFLHRFLTALFRGAGEAVALDRGARLRGGIVGLVPALLLTWAAAMAVRVTGATATLRELEAAVRTGQWAPAETAGLLPRLQQGLSTGSLGSLLNRLDPLDTRRTTALASLLVLRHGEEAWRRALRHPQAGPLVLHPAVQKLLRDHDVTRALSFSDYTQLLTLPELTEALQDTGLSDALAGADLPALLRACITGQTGPAGIPRAVPVPEP